VAIHFNDKEFKDLLKTFSKLSSQCSNTHAPISFDFEPFRMVMITEHAFISATPQTSIIPPVYPYTFNPEILLNLTFTEGDVELFWENSTSALCLKNNHLRTSLKVAVPTPEFDVVPSQIDSIEIPLGFLIGIKKYLDIPFVFFTGNKELMPICFYRDDNGNLVVTADDGFSIARITTPIQVPAKLKKLDIKVPKYIIDCLYSKGDLSDETTMRVGVNGFKSLFANKTIQIYSSSMNDETSSFEHAIDGFKPKVSCAFSPRKLSQGIKPLVGMIPKKDRPGTILSTKFTDKISMSISHSDVGEGVMDFVDGISDIYLENDLKNVTINMHPLAFQEYTNLMDVDTANMYADTRLVHYKGDCTMGGISATVEYIFPTVQV